MAIKRRPLVVFVTIVLLLSLLSACASSGEQDGAGASSPSRANYIENKGSDTIVNLALAWAELYQQQHADVSISVTGGGSGTGIASLLNGTVDIASASRAITPGEIANANRVGIEPQEVIIARDAIAVIVNPSNPVQELTMQQISEIFQGNINNWREVGGEDLPIVRVSRETNSGTHVYFLEEVVRLGDSDSHVIFAADTLLLPSSEGIISEVGDNPHAIGYDGLGYVTSHVKVVGVAKEVGAEYVMPSVETVNSGMYPISRDLYMYTTQNPSPLTQTYLEWILSPEAQQIVVDLGFVPVK